MSILKINKYSNIQFQTNGLNLKMLRRSCASILLLCSSRPPLALFLSSLLLISLTAFSLALYVQSSPLPNPDILDWSRLLEEMSELKYCLYQPNPDTPASNSSLVSVSRADIHPPLYSTLIKPAQLSVGTFLAQGWIPLDHMGLGHKNQQVEVTISRLGEARDFCLQVRGAAPTLRSLNSTKETCSCPPDKKLRHFTAHASSHLSRNWCSNGSQFTFLPEILPDYGTQLTDDERSVAVKHLTLAAFALLALIVGILLCVGRSIKTIEGRRTAGDERGDLQLLSTHEED